MYSLLKRAVLWLLQVPPEPRDPAGNEGSLRIFRAARGYLKMRYLGWFVRQLVLVASLAAGFVSMHLALERSRAPEIVFQVLAVVEVPVIVIIVLQALVSLATVRLDYEMRWYKVSDRSLRIREGVYLVREMTMTFANIQNISVAQGPLQRLFGIADLKVDSAGGGGGGALEAKGDIFGQTKRFNMHTAFFRGVDDAEEIKTLMLDRQRGARDSGLGDQGDHEESFSPPRVQTAPSAAVRRALEELRDEAQALRSAAEQSIRPA
jgi:membrane protein YdbS with pleckstrin-like domain